MEIWVDKYIDVITDRIKLLAGFMVEPIGFNLAVQKITI